MANDSMHERMTELESRLTMCERLVKVLQDEIATLRTTPRGSVRTMAEHSCCPACGHRRILFADEVLDRDSTGTQTAMSIGMTTWLNRPVAKFQIYACVSCGFCEWYAPELSGFVDDLCKKHKGFRIIDVTDVDAKKAPYR